MNITLGISCLCKTWGSPLSGLPEDLLRQEVVVTTISGSVLRNIMFFTVGLHMNPHRLFYVCLILFLWIMAEEFDYCGFMCEVRRALWSSTRKKSLDVSCVSCCSCRGKPVPNGPLLRWKRFCSICITSACLTGPE